MFAPRFVEDVPGVGVAVLANGLAGNGFIVLVHDFFAERGDVFDPKVRVTGRRLRVSELLTMFDTAEPNGTAKAKSSGTGEPQPKLAPEPASAPSPPPVPLPGAVWSPAGAPTPRLPLPGPRQGQARPPAARRRPPAPSPPQGQARPPGSVPIRPPAPVPTRVPASASPPVPVPPPPQVPSPQAPPLGLPASNGWPGPRTSADHPATAGEHVAAKRGRVIAVASAKGGVGKTSTTVNLAAFAARLLRSAGRSGSVALVDTNFQQADVARYLNLKSPTVLDLLQQPGALSADTARKHLAHIPEIDLYALLGPPDAVNADPALINSSLYRRILMMLRETFDFVFIDTPVAELYHTTFTDLILPEADAILVPIEPSRVTLEAANAWLKAITMPQHTRGGGVAPEKLSLLLNRARTDVGCSPEDVLDLMPGWRFVGMIPEDQEWMHAVNNRQLIALRINPDLEVTFRAVLRVLTDDPVFDETTVIPPANAEQRRRRRLFRLNSK